jgi:hypothetical protein
MATNLSGDDELMRYFLVGLGSAIALLFPQLVQAQSRCPDTIQPLTKTLLKDLPGYANRVIQRSQLTGRSQANSTYIIVAGKPEFNPITQNIQGDYTPAFPEAETESVKQIFFTTLERQYRKKAVHSVQNYHWLFLTKTSQGWRLVFLYSRFGLPDKTHPPTPPKETSNGIIGKAIQLWLRDCRFQDNS